MLNKFNYILIIIFSLLLSACSTPLKKQELSQIKNIAIVNTAPENPSFVFIGTTIFNNASSPISELQMRAISTRRAVDKLNKMGYQVTIFESKKEAVKSKNDLIVEIAPDAFSPNGNYYPPGANGYGIYQHKTFAFERPSLAYIYLSTLISSKKGKSYKMRDFASTRKNKKIAIKIVKEWTELPPETRAEINHWLVNETEKSVDDMLIKVNL